jgi:hypothetical protein
MDKGDERFTIEGDPEDALRGLMEPREYTVRIGEQHGSAEYDGTPPRDMDPTPEFRVFEWTGSAPDKDDAIEQAHVAFAAKHGERPKGPYSVHVIPSA